MQAKICGIKTLAAAQAAETYGAAFVGFMFYEKSRRCVSSETAKKIAATLKKTKTVGVFVNEDAARVNEIADFVHLDYVQLHGDEPPAYAREIRRPVIKAFRYGDNFSIGDALAYPAAYVILDSGTKEQPGGTGKNFAWRAAAETLAPYPELKKKLLIAGGVKTETIGEIQNIFHPYGVDVSGSLETDSEKDIAKIKTFLEELARVNATSEEVIK